MTNRIVISFILLLISISSCNQSSNIVETCTSDIILINRSSIGLIQRNYIIRRTTNISKSDSIYVRKIIILGDLLFNMADTLIDASGGIIENTDKLSNSCMRGEIIVNKITKLEFLHNLQILILNLNPDPNSEVQLLNFEKVNFLFQSKIIDENSYFDDPKLLGDIMVGTIISDLYAIQGFVYNLLLVDFFE